MNSWTVSLYQQTRHCLRPLSFWRYRGFSCNEPQSPTPALLRVRLKSPYRQTVFLREWGSDPLTFEEVFLKEVYRPVVQVLGACRTMIDLGANIGLASVYLSAHLGCRGVCVEPNPDTFDVLRKNLANSGMTLLQAAAWNSAASLSVACDDAHYSMATVRPESGGAVRGLSVPQIIARAGFQTVDLLKVDIEGAEAEIFRGDLSWLAAIRAIAIEFHGDSRRSMQFDAIMHDRKFRLIESGHTTVAIRQ